MSGRHRSYATPQRNAPRSSFPTGLVAGGAVVVVIAGVAFFAYAGKKGGGTANASSPGGATSCANPVDLTVAASPDIAGAISQIAAQSGGCAHITVAQTEPYAVASYLAGTAKAGDVTAQPDVWIPDTSLWLDVARATPAGQQAVPAAGTSIATTPAVLAMPQPVAQALGWPAKPFGWQDLLANQASAHPLQVSVPDPTANGVGLATIAAIRALTLQAAGNDPTKQQAAAVNLTAVFRGMSNNVQGSLSTLLTALPTAEATSATSGGIAAFPATEQKIWAYNNAKPAVPLAAFYPTEGTAMLDYPYTESAHLDPAKKSAAETFLAALRGPAANTALNSAGFRDAKGATGGAITTNLGLNPQTPALLPADPTHTAATESLKVWKTISQQTRGLIVLDVSGSMGLPVPGQTDGAGNPVTRIQMVAAACQGGLPLFGDSSEVGLWTFTSKTAAAGGGTIHTELVPLGPLGQAVNGVPRRSAFAAAFQSLSIQRGSRNGLYDTILDAYKTVQNGWAENKSNAVVVFTDGKDDGLNSMSADALITKLKALQAAAPNHPVHVLVVAMGQGVDLTTLSKITAATGGRALTAATPQQIGTAVLEGFANRLGE